VRAPAFGILMSHAVGFGGRWELIDDDRSAHLRAGIREAQEIVRATAPDLIIAYVNDHLKNFTLRGMPAFCIGVADDYRAPSSSAAAELRIPARTIPGEPDLAMSLLEAAMNSGFDPAFSAELAFYDDLSVPLLHLFGSGPVPPVVPIVTNCVAPPLPTFARCFDFGAMIGRALAASGAGYERVMILGSGGVSHWVGTPQTGVINQDFDGGVLAMVAANRLADMREWSDEEVDRTAGNGALELKNWLMALATIGPHVTRSLAYAPVREWLTGIAICAVDTPRTAAVTTVR
jgi:hypothetical protein